MKYLYCIFFSFLFSCVYPDIDSVPDFDNLVINQNEAFDLCKLSNKNLKQLNKCKQKYFEKEEEKKAIIFCKLIESKKTFVNNASKNDFKKCLDEYAGQLSNDENVISLCKINNTDKDYVNKCIKKYNNQDIE